MAYSYSVIRDEYDAILNGVVNALPVEWQKISLIYNYDIKQPSIRAETKLKYHADQLPHLNIVCSQVSELVDGVQGLVGEGKGEVGQSLEEDRFV